MKLLKKIAGLVLAIPAAWIAYSHFFINHDEELTPALPADPEIWPSKNAGPVAYYADTRGSGRPLVLVHSVNAAASAKEMQPIFEWARGRRPVFALDLPGYGLSNRENRFYSPELFANVIVEFLNEVVGEPADVVALSLGCEFVARAAVDVPHLFDTLTFISPTGFNVRETQEAVGEPAGRSGSEQAFQILSFPLWSQALYDLITSRPSLRYYLSKSFAYREPPEELLAYGYQTSHQPGAQNVPLYFLSGQLFTRDIETTIYPRLTMPVQVIFDQDPYINFDRLPNFLAANPIWTATRIPGTNGLPHWERPEETFKAIERFQEKIQAQ